MCSQAGTTTTEEPYVVTSCLSINYGDFLGSGQRQRLIMINTAAWKQSDSPSLITRTIVLVTKMQVCCFGNDHWVLTVSFLGLVTCYCWPLTLLASSRTPDVSQAQLTLKLKNTKSEKRMERSMHGWMGGWFGDGTWVGAPSVACRTSLMDAMRLLWKHDHPGPCYCPSFLR